MPWWNKSWIKCNLIRKLSSTGKIRKYMPSQSRLSNCKVKCSILDSRNTVENRKIRGHRLNTNNLASSVCSCKRRSNYYRQTLKLWITEITKESKNNRSTQQALKKTTTNCFRQSPNYKSSWIPKINLKLTVPPTKNKCRSWQPTLIMRRHSWKLSSRSRLLRCRMTPKRNRIWCKR